MPMVKRKVVELVPPPIAAGTDDPDVFYLETTGEVFADYDAYASRLTFYNQKLFQCELTGKINLTYFEALKSERHEAIALHKIFPEQLKEPVLRSVQFHVTGRLDHLVDRVYDRFKDRFFPAEHIFVEKDGEKYYARVKHVEPPPPSQDATTSVLKDEDGEAVLPSHIHRVGTNLSLELEEANQLDNPAHYTYHVELLDNDDQPTGSVSTTTADKISRDRLAFSKTILRKYMRDCVTRAANIGAEWIVKDWLARKYDIPLEPTDEIAQKNEALKDAKLSKRKKYLYPDGDDASGLSLLKKFKSDGRKPTAAARRKADEAEKAALEQAKEEERLRKKNLKYPIEDLELDPISNRELKFKMPGELPRRKERPIPARGAHALPVSAELFEVFIVTYYFLVSLGKPLLLSPFTLDDYEHALRHPNVACNLITEIHSVLINTIVRDGGSHQPLKTAITALATDAVTSSSAPASINGDADDSSLSEAASDVDELDTATHGANGAHPSDDAEIVQSIFEEARKLGQGWETKPLRTENRRQGWEHSLVGLLATRATVETLPRLVGILSHLTGIEHRDGTVDGEWIADTYISPVDRYPLLQLRDKLQIIDFLCLQAVVTKPVKSFYDECEAQVTELRKEKIEISRERRKLAEARDEFEGRKRGDATGAGAEHEGEDGTDEARLREELEGEEEEGLTSDSELESNAAADNSEEEEEDELISDDDGDEEDDSSSGGGGRRRQHRRGPTKLSRQEILRQKAIERKASDAARAAEQAKAREAHKAKLAESKALTAQKKKMDEDEVKLARRDEAIEREFRRMFLAPRIVPLGRDRFGDKYWWFDGVGSCSLVTAAPTTAAGGVTAGGDKVTYQTGRLFVQGASDDETAALVPTLDEATTSAAADGNAKPLSAVARFALLLHPPITADLVETRKSEELGGDEGRLTPNEWAVYTDPDQIDQLLAWLRVKGHREHHLKTQLLKFKSYLDAGLKKRNADIHAHILRDTLGEQQHQQRRSTRAPPTTGAENARSGYLAWKNLLDRPTK